MYLLQFRIRYEHYFPSIVFQILLDIDRWLGMYHVISKLNLNGIENSW